MDNELWFFFLLNVNSLFIIQMGAAAAASLSFMIMGRID